MCGALFLFSGGITMIYSASHIERDGCKVFQLVSAGPIPRDHSFSEQSSSFLSSLPSLLPFVPRKAGSESDGEVMCHYFGEKIVGGVSKKQSTKIKYRNNTQIANFYSLKKCFTLWFLLKVYFFCFYTVVQLSEWGSLRNFSFRHFQHWSWRVVSCEVYNYSFVVFIF